MGMLSALRNRRVWVAALLVLLFTPVVGMAYLNRGWLAALYLLLFLAIGGGAILAYPQAAHTAALLTYALYGMAGVMLVGTLHAIWIAHWYDPSRALRWYAKRWYLIAVILLLPVAALGGLRAYAYEPVMAASTSMTPSIHFRDQLLVSRFRERDNNPQRGDVVMLYSPDAAANVIKRVVGMPGDSIQMQGGILFINGVPVSLRRLEDVMAPCEDTVCRAGQYEETLPDGHKGRILNRESTGQSDNTDLYFVPADGYFVLGDDRDNSRDSRHTGPVMRQYLLGRVILRYLVDRRWTWQPVD
jgi:signal peptidase I